MRACVCVSVCSVREPTGEAGRDSQTALRQSRTDGEREGGTRPSFSIQGGGVDR